MKTGMNSLMIVVKTTLFGIFILGVFTIMVFFISKPIIDAIFPPKFVEGLDMAANTNGARYIHTFLLSYFLGGCVSGFISGFLIKRWGRETATYFWQSLVSGYLIGASGPAFVLLVITQRSFYMEDMIIISDFGIPAALGGLLGYYIGGRRYKQIVSPNE